MGRTAYFGPPAPRFHYYAQQTQMQLEHHNRRLVRKLTGVRFLKATSLDLQFYSPRIGV